MISIDNIKFDCVSFRLDEKHPIMVTYKWDGETEMLFCQSPLSDKICDEVKAAIKQRCDNCGTVSDLKFWSEIKSSRHTD